MGQAQQQLQRPLLVAGLSPFNLKDPNTDSSKCRHIPHGQLQNPSSEKLSSHGHCCSSPAQKEEHADEIEFSIPFSHRLPGSVKYARIAGFCTAQATASGSRERKSWVQSPASTWIHPRLPALEAHSGSVFLPSTERPHSL